LIFLSNGGNSLKKVEDMTMDELKQAIVDEQNTVAANDVKMKADGFTHRVTYWNYTTGGSDVQADTYFGADPTTLTYEDGEAWSLWQQIKVASLGDYKVIEL